MPVSQKPRRFFAGYSPDGSPRYIYGGNKNHKPGKANPAGTKLTARATTKTLGMRHYSGAIK